MLIHEFKIWSLFVLIKNEKKDYVSVYISPEKNHMRSCLRCSLLDLQWDSINGVKTKTETMAKKMQQHIFHFPFKSRRYKTYVNIWRPSSILFQFRALFGMKHNRYTFRSNNYFFFAIFCTKSVDIKNVSDILTALLACLWDNFLVCVCEDSSE